MARRRYQSGSVFKRGKNWVLRYREDIRNSDGSIERLHRSVVLGELATKKEAKREAGTLLRDINSGDRHPQSCMTFADFWHGYFVSEVLDKRKFSTRQVYGYLADKHLPLAEAQRRAVEQMATILFPNVPTLAGDTDRGKVLIQ